MCNLETEGILYSGCGHYKATGTLAKLDCGLEFCRHSAAHKDPCRSCKCDPYLGPDRKEVILRTIPDFCPHCEYWFRGPGSKPRVAAAEEIPPPSRPTAPPPVSRSAMSRNHM